MFVSFNIKPQIPPTTGYCISQRKSDISHNFAPATLVLCSTFLKKENIKIKSNLKYYNLSVFVCVFR